MSHLTPRRVGGQLSLRPSAERSRMPPGRFAARASHGIERERSFSRESGSNRRQMRFPVHYSESARYQPIGRHHRPWRDPTAHRRRICLRNIATRRRQDLAFRWAAMSCSSLLPSTYAKVDGSIVAAWRLMANMRALALRGAGRGVNVRQQTQMDKPAPKCPMAALPMRFVCR